MAVTDFTRTFNANGNIAPSRAVKIDTSKDFSVIQGTANSKNCGIAQKGERLDPSNSDGFAAIAGEAILVYGDGAKDVPAQLGGSVTRGDRLKSDANGKLVVVASNNDEVCAVANQNGAADELISVDVVIYQYGA